MLVTTILFWFFAAAMLISGVLAITRHNPVNSAMCLIQLFLCMAGLFLLLEAPFLAVVQVLVYAGAVMVLFLFVIMLLDLKPGPIRSFPFLSGIGALALAAAIGTQLVSILRDAGVATDEGPLLHAGLKDVVRPLFTNYQLPFLVTALVLLTAMIGIVTLTRKDDAS